MPECPFCSYTVGHEPQCLGGHTVAGPFDSAEKVEAEKRRAREATYDERFRAFHAANPDVYEELVALARKARAAGHQRIGMKMLWEVLRWNRLLQPDRAADEFKLNNNFHSRYARLIAEQEPDLRDAFEVRELRAA